MLRKPCSRNAAASRFTSSIERVTRKIGLSREKPQYLQLLMHSLDTYNGAKRRMTLPKRCCVSFCARAEIGSSNPVAAGEIRLAKSFKDSLLFARLSRTACGEVASEPRTSEANGRELNSVTKLTFFMIAKVELYSSTFL